MCEKGLNCAPGRRGPAAGLRKAACSIVSGGALAAALLAAAGAGPATALAHASRNGPPAAARPAGSAWHSPGAAAASGASQWNHIAAGGEHTCGIHLGNTLWCWGDNDDGQLGIGTTTSHNQPQQVTRPTARWASVTAGGEHTCATRSDTTLWCWGDNSDGQLGTGTTTSQDLPQQVTTPSATGWASVTASGGAHTCATRDDTSLWCWGANSTGQLGIGNITDQHLPAQVTTPAGTGWASITAGGAHTCATRSDTTLWCWGENGAGQLGIGNTTNQHLPQQVTTPAATSWASVTAGIGHTCATRDDSSLWCWGYNGSGQLGIGNMTDQDLPQQVTTPATTGWTTAAGGGYHTCATRTHALWCWGHNIAGQLGIGNNTDQAQPQRIPLPTTTGWTLIAPGTSHTCATHTGHTLWCWGYNDNGQLGIGNQANQNLPQQVTS